MVRGRARQLWEHVINQCLAFGACTPPLAHQGLLPPPPPSPLPNCPSWTPPPHHYHAPCHSSPTTPRCPTPSVQRRIHPSPPNTLPTTPRHPTPSARRNNHPSPPNTLATCHPTHPCMARLGTETQNTHHGHKGGGGRGCMMCLPQGGLGAGLDRQKFVMRPGRGKDPASGHPRAHKLPLGRGPSLPGW